MKTPQPHIIFSLFIFFICYAKSLSSPCGDWEQYKDEKCFKIIDKTLRSYEDAEKTCNQQENDATLIIIRSKEEQDFLSNLLFNTYNVVDNVWIGIKYTSNKFKWVDNSDLNFANWAGGSPQNGTGYNCVQMIPDIVSVGKWINEPCEKRNLVVCQKMQIWPTSLLQKTLVELRDSLENVKEQLENTKNQLRDAQNKLSASTPAGIVAFFARNTAPTGWLKANGSVVSRTTYSDLFAAIGTTFGSGDGSNTFMLPDLRSEFIRGWSDDREADKGRVFGSFQWGSNIPMAGYISGSSGLAIVDAYQDHWTFAGSTFDDGFETNVPAGQTRSGTSFPSSQVLTVVYNGNGDISTWNVLKGSRPRNVALLACIKY